MDLAEIPMAVRHPLRVLQYIRLGRITAPGGWDTAGRTEKPRGKRFTYTRALVPALSSPPNEATARTQ